ncbi:MAG: hypothetical protein ACTSW1_05745 [Candidatus Hodarchaeales archaeon]
MKKTFQYKTPLVSDVEAPYLPLVLSDPLDMHSETVFGMIDTGYDGEILIPYQLFKELNLEAFEFSLDIVSYAETASGELLKLLSANASVMIEGIDISLLVIIDSHKECKEVLIGRRFLENYNLLLQGQLRKLEIEFQFLD